MIYHLSPPTNGVVGNIKIPKRLCVKYSAVKNIAVEYDTIQIIAHNAVECSAVIYPSLGPLLVRVSNAPVHSGNPLSVIYLLFAVVSILRV